MKKSFSLASFYIKFRGGFYARDAKCHIAVCLACFHNQIHGAKTLYVALEPLN